MALCARRMAGHVPGPACGWIARRERRLTRLVGACVSRSRSWEGVNLPDHFVVIWLLAHREASSGECPWPTGRASIQGSWSRQRPASQAADAPLIGQCPAGERTSRSRGALAIGQRLLKVRESALHAFGYRPLLAFGPSADLPAVVTGLLERGGGPYQLLQRGLHAAQDRRHRAGGLWGARRLADGRGSRDEIATMVVELVVRIAAGRIDGMESTHEMSLPQTTTREMRSSPHLGWSRVCTWGSHPLATDGVTDGPICGCDLMVGERPRDASLTSYGQRPHLVAQRAASTLLLLTSHSSRLRGRRGCSSAPPITPSSCESSTNCAVAIAASSLSAFATRGTSGARGCRRPAGGVRGCRRRPGEDRAA